MAVEYLGEAHSAHEADNSITVAYTAPMGTNYAVILGFSNCTTGPQGVSTCTYDGSAATYIIRAKQYDATDWVVTMYGYPSPVVGVAKNVVVGFSGNADNLVVIVSLGGVDLGDPYHDALNADKTDATPSQVVAASVATGELAIGASSFTNAAGGTAAASAPQTQIYGETRGAWTTAGTCGYQAGAGGNITLSYTYSAAPRAASCCAVFAAAPSGTTPAMWWF